MRRGRRRSGVLLLLLGSVAAATLAPAGAGAADGPVHQAFRARARASASAARPVITPESGYVGPLLVLEPHLVGREAAEPTIAVTRGGLVFYAAAKFNDGLSPATPRTEILVSGDQGETWFSVQQTAPDPALSVPPTTLDPYVYVDPATDRVFSVDLYGGCSLLSYTDNSGESWTNNPAACDIPVNDHQTLAAGPPPAGTSTLGYPSVIYYCVNQVAGATCARSLDGGDTFTNAGLPAFEGVGPNGEICSSLHGHVVVDDEGRVFLPRGCGDEVQLAVSEDGGLTWSRSVASNLPSAAYHTSVAVDDAGTVYYVWWDNKDRLPYLAVSRDHGATFGPALLVAPPGVKETNFPTMDAGIAGQVVISFPGTTWDDRDDNTRPWNFYVMTSTDALSEAPLFVSSTSNAPSDPIHRGDCGPGRCAGMWDFLDIVLAPTGDLWAAAVDTCTAVNECNSPDGGQAAYPSAPGLAIRSASGPGLRGTPVFRSVPVKPPAPSVPGRPTTPARPTTPDRPLPSTGINAGIAWLAVAALVTAAALGRGRVARTR